MTRFLFPTALSVILVFSQLTSLSYAKKEQDLSCAGMYDEVELENKADRVECLSYIGMCDRGELGNGDNEGELGNGDGGELGNRDNEGELGNRDNEGELGNGDNEGELGNRDKEELGSESDEVVKGL
ncbi:hypothetical protein BDR04DRAFT_1118599 [Suillus decipiens]|nr:hypothetical protein BDR04DRAFT_1118599 [Suillus decipiens]